MTAVARGARRLGTAISIGAVLVGSILGTAAMADEAAFKSFDELARTDYSAEEGSVRYYYEDCAFVAWKLSGAPVTTVDFSYLGPPGLGGLRLPVRSSLPLPGNTSYYPKISVSALSVDLRQVERVERSFGPKVTVVMKRGHTLSHARATILSDTSSPEFTRTRSLDVAKLDILIHITNDQRYHERLSFIPDDWRAVMSSEQALRQWLLRERPTMPLPHRTTVKSEQSRSVSWNFAHPWPEDADKINQAFADLVERCR